MPQVTVRCHTCSFTEEIDVHVNEGRGLVAVTVDARMREWSLDKHDHLICPYCTRERASSPLLDRSKL